MYKRHFISKLIGTRHYIVLIGLLTSHRGFSKRVRPIAASPRCLRHL